MSTEAPRCLVFEDGDDWIVYAPASQAVMRVNSAAADKFRDMPDTGGVMTKTVESDAFLPTDVTISCTAACANACVYCYGTPAHAMHDRLDLDFCRAGVDFAAANAKAAGIPMRAFFHGVGEPTLYWTLFQDCVRAVREASERRDVPAQINLCTSGQLNHAQAYWISEHLDCVHISFDGLPDIQRQQRPRKDGRDSVAPPVYLGKALVRAGKPLTIKVTVTDLGVHKMKEIVEYAAAEFGRVTVDFCEMVGLAWTCDAIAQPADPEVFVANFVEALDRGRKLGVVVQHPTVSLNTLSTGSYKQMNHFCLAPPQSVIMFYDTPGEGGSHPESGKYGHFDPADGRIHFDHETRKTLARSDTPAGCRVCPCRYTCGVTSGVRGRIGDAERDYHQICYQRVEILKELVRRITPKRSTPKKEVSHA